MVAVALLPCVLCLILITLQTVTSARNIYAPKVSRFWNCSEPEIRPVLIKFHKVGGESIREYFFENLKYESTFYHWNKKSCPGIPFEHPTMLSYMLFGDETGSLSRSRSIPTHPDQFKRCVLPKACPMWPIQLVTTLRDPLERFISSLHHFSAPTHTAQFFTERVRDLRKRDERGLKYDNPQLINHPQEKVLFQILTNPRNISVTQMDSFLKYVRKKPHVQNGIFQKYIINPYERVLTKDTRNFLPSSNQSLNIAKRNLKTHFSVVGYLESIESLFVLLTLQFKDRQINETCSIHRNEKSKKSKQFKSWYDAFQPSVIAVLQSYLGNEYAIHDYAKVVHEQQLQHFGLTQIKAKQMWLDICRPDENKAVINNGDI